MNLKPMTVTIFFPSDMEVGEDRARWYLDHAIRGYWKTFAHTETDPIRNMRRCSVSIKPSMTSTTQPTASPQPTATTTEVSEASLDERMEAAGMIPLSKLLAGDAPLEKWMAHTSVRDLASFEAWLLMRQREFMHMRVAYELGDKDKADELYEWVFAHTAALGEVISNFRKALSAPSGDGVPGMVLVPREDLRRALVLLRLPTVRQVINAGDDAIDAAGLNPWAMNEGLATGDERISPSFIDDWRAMLSTTAGEPK
jgi:hypothetical protein